MRLSPQTLKVGPSEPRPVTALAPPKPRRSRRALLLIPLLLLAAAATAWYLWAPPRTLKADAHLIARRFEAQPHGQGRVLWRAGPAGTAVASGERVLEVERLGPEVVDTVEAIEPDGTQLAAPSRQVTDARVKAARAELRGAAIRERAARAALKRVEALLNRGGAIAPEVDRAREELARASAAVELARAHVVEVEVAAAAPASKLVIPPSPPPITREVFYAPFNATVMRAPVAEGEVTTMTEPALVLVERDIAEVEALVTDDQVGLLRTGLAAEVELTGSGRTSRHLGVISSIGGAPREPLAPRRPHEPALVPVRIHLAQPLAVGADTVDGRPLRVTLRLERR